MKKEGAKSVDKRGVGVYQEHLGQQVAAQQGRHSVLRETHSERRDST